MLNITYTHSGVPAALPPTHNPVSTSCLSSWRIPQPDVAAPDEILHPGPESSESLFSVLLFQINTNGFVSFAAPPPPEREYLGKTPVAFKMVAVLLGDLDNSDGRGTVHFRQDSSPKALRRAGEHVQRAFPGSVEAKPVDTFVVTWENMAAAGDRGGGQGLDGKVDISASSTLSSHCGTSDCFCFTFRGTPSSWWWRPQKTPPTPSSCSLSRACSSSPRQRGASSRPALTKGWWGAGFGQGRGCTSAPAAARSRPSAAFLGTDVTLSPRGEPRNVAGALPWEPPPAWRMMP